MIDIDFSPNSIISLFHANEEAKDSADIIERISLPENEDIENELLKSKKDLDSYAKTIISACDSVKSELSNILNKDFEHKFNLFVQLLSNYLIEESFPIQAWVNEKEKLDEIFSKNDFSLLVNKIHEIKNEKIKEKLINEYFNIIKVCLNSEKYFKYNSGLSLLNESEIVSKKLNISDADIFERLKNYTYQKENDKNIKLNSNANFWKIYSLLKNKETEKSVEFLLDIKEDEIKNFVNFLGKTDFIFIKDVRFNTIKGFSGNNLRETLFLAENKELREKFFPKFLISLENYKNKISDSYKESFEYVIKELTQGHQYFTLLNKFDKKLPEIKKHKI